MQLNVLPILRKDETLYSFAARTRLSNAAKDDRDACRSMFGYSKISRISEFPINFPHFCEYTKGILGDPESVLESMTLAGFFERVGGHTWHKGCSEVPLTIAGYGLSMLSNGNLRNWRICPLCIEADLNCYSTSYWRRSHQLPTSFVCLTHGVSLENSIAFPHKRHNQFLLPSNELSFKEACTHLLLKKNEEVQLRLTKLGNDILQFPCDTYGSDTESALVLNAMIRRALKERGLMTQSGSLRPKEFTTEFTNRYCFLQPNTEYAVAVSERGINSLRRSLQTPKSWRSITHRLLLIEWLFGSWSSFNQQFTWQRTMDQCDPYLTLSEPPNLRNTNSINNIELLSPNSKEHRATCIEFLEHYKTAKRNEFARAKPRCFRWLLNHDLDWFNKYFPVFQRKHIQTNLFHDIRL
ncbi:TniQ family protein [Undibacterium sp. SXout11W]|uniref:TniQ family protein n=1 Tax=Undibacterium sp. SXout11W TaxID=3413050 RepID=UPI003BF38FC0